MKHEVNQYERLLAYVAGDLSAEEAAAIEAELATDTDAARVIADYRMIAAAVQADAARPVPAELIAKAKAIFRRRAVQGPGLVDRLRALVADLTFDSRAEVALAGLRGQAQAHQLSYQAGDLEIDLQLDPVGEGDGRRWRVLGQVSADELPQVRSVQLTAAGSEQVLDEASADEHAMFSLDLEAGVYDLFLDVAGERIVLQGLRMP